jgi:ankyrin repeat protein
MLAAANGEKSAVKLFLEAGADTEAKNAVRTPFKT